MAPGKPESGAQKRKRRKQEQKLIESQRGSLHKFLKSNASSLRNPDELALVLVEEQSNVDLEDGIAAEDNVDINADDNNVSDHDHVFNSSSTESPSVDEEPVSVDIYDPVNGSSLDNKARDTLVEKEPTREENITYPLDGNSRHFSSTHYSRKMINGEVRDRKWLVYSKHVDRVFCFCCKLFNSSNCKSTMANDGFNDWKHISERLKEHEASV
jgi:ribosomal protein L35